MKLFEEDDDVIDILFKICICSFFSFLIFMFIMLPIMIICGVING